MSRPAKHYITYNGITDTYVGWARRTGISRDAIWLRIQKYGWTVEQALTTKVRKKSGKALVDGDVTTIAAYCRSRGLDEKAIRKIRKRMLRGMSLKASLRMRRRKGRKERGRWVVDGYLDTISGHCRQWNIPIATVFKRLDSGMPLLMALSLPKGRYTPWLAADLRFLTENMHQSRRWLAERLPRYTKVSIDNQLRKVRAKHGYVIISGQGGWRNHAHAI